MERNPILDTAFALIEATAPGALLDPEKAYRAMVPRLRHIEVSCDHPTVEQLRELQTWGSLRSMNLLQLRKSLAAGTLRLEPIPVDVAQEWKECLEDVGFVVSLIALSADEQHRMLSDVGLSE